MEVGTLSPSKIQRMRLCEARVESQLHDDEYEEEKGEAAGIGTLAHESAKLWYRKDAATGQWLFADTQSCFQAAIESCIAKEVRRHGGVAIVSELPKEASSIQDARTLFDMIVAHYRRDVLKILFTERRYKGTLKNGVPVHLIIDLALDRGNGVMEIVDYKTGWLTISTDEMWDSDQVIMNLLAVSLDPEFAAYPSKQFTYLWVKKGFETGPISFSMERLTDYEYWLALEYKRILEITEPTESLNRFCPSCGRRFECKKYREFMSEAMGLEKLPDDAELKVWDDDVVMARFDRLKGQIKLLEDFKDKLSDHLKQVLKQRAVEELEGKQFKSNIRSAKHNSFSVQTVVALCQQHGKDFSTCFSIKQKEVETLFSSNPEAMQQLTLTMKRGQTQPSLSVTQVGVKKRVTPRKKKEPAAAPLPEMPIQPAPGTAPVNMTEHNVVL